MKLPLLLPILALTAAASLAQTTSSAPPVSSQTNLQTEQNQAKKGKVLFQRSTDENGQVVEGTPAQAPAEKPTPIPTTSQPPVVVPSSAAQLTAEDAERAAETFTDFDLDVRLRPEENRLAVRSLIAIRNDGKTPLAHIRLQISSALEWEQVRQPGRPSAFTVALLNSDTDHTGQLHEAVFTPPTPLAPGKEIQLDALYSGAITQSAKRLLAIGTPQQVADQSDWDRVTTEFTGLRGFGNVLWYPAASVPVILGDGNRLFDEIGEHKLRTAGAHFRLNLTIETPPGLAPTVALVNGHPVDLAVSQGADASVASLASARVQDSVLGFESPSLFFASRVSHPIPNATLWTRPDSDPNVAAWQEAATRVIPFLQGWLGQRPRSQLTVLELPEDGDIPFETGALLAAPIRAAQPDVLDGVMAHALTHAWVQSPRAWLNEGVAHFMGTLWIEKQQGRDRALATLDSGRAALAILEPESPGSGDGQPLIACISPVYYRTKAAYVLWMLRDLVGDTTLSAALRGYSPAQDNTPDTFEKLLENAGQRRDLHWFFADWVYTDKGLPDISIESVFPSPAATKGTYLVAVNLANSGYAAAEVPVQVISETATVTQRVVLAARGKATQRILLQGDPIEARANDATIPESQSTIHSMKIDRSAPRP